MTHRLRFQYLAPDAVRPTSGYTISDIQLEIHPSMPIPRIGEIVSHDPFSGRDYLLGDPLIVLSVHYDIVRNPDDHRVLQQYLVTVVLGDIPKGTDSRLYDIRD